MKCPFCQKSQTRVVDSRLSSCQTQIKRRRHCDRCKARFSTYETPQIEWPKVLKEDGTKENFDVNKLKKGLVLSCDKLNIPNEKIDFYLGQVKKNILLHGQKDISSKKIGEYVTEQLLKLDPVAYIRFAAVYKRCHDVDEINHLLQKINSSYESTS
jgi:transcriptional repressor NrdR